MTTLRVGCVGAATIVLRGGGWRERIRSEAKMRPSDFFRRLVVESRKEERWEGSMGGTREQAVGWQLVEDLGENKRDFGVDLAFFLLRLQPHRFHDTRGGWW